MHKRLSLGALGLGALATVLVGAWAGIVVFVGPSFGYSVDGTGAWRWDEAHAWLHFAPGVAAVVAGLLMLAALGRAVSGGATRGVGLAGLLSIVAGAWLVLGPTAWPTVVTTHRRVWAVASPLHNLAHQVGANLGPGALLIVFGALSMGLVNRYRYERVFVPTPYRGEKAVAA